MLEYEKKIIVTHNEYLLLKRLYNMYNPTYQRNYYYDTNDFLLSKSGITCRIRSKEGRFTFTLKYPYTQNAKKEFSKSIDKIYNIVYFEEKPLILQGFLETERNLLYRDELCEIVLDKNTYLGKTDYELEIEYYPKHERQVNYWMEKIEHEFYLYNLCSGKSLIDRTFYSRSKAQRFFKRKRQLERIK